MGWGGVVTYRLHNKSMHIHDHIDVVRALLAGNADPRIVALDSTTALDDAKRNKHTAIVALLEARLAELAAASSA